MLICLQRVFFLKYEKWGIKYFDFYSFSVSFLSGSSRETRWLSIQLLSSRFCLGRFLKLKEFSTTQTPDFDFFNQTQMGERWKQNCWTKLKFLLEMIIFGANLAVDSLAKLLREQPRFPPTLKIQFGPFVATSESVRIWMFSLSTEGAFFRFSAHTSATTRLGYQTDATAVM